MTKQRNPEATCATCPHWKRVEDAGHEELGVCHRLPNISGHTHETWWCGEHPDFFLEETHNAEPT